MSSAGHAALTGPDRHTRTTAEIMDMLRDFPAHDTPSSWENFYPFMEDLFGPEWRTTNTLTMRSSDQWGGKWRCQMCERTPDGIDQLIAHVQGSQHIRFLTTKMALAHLGATPPQQPTTSGTSQAF
eukprot:6898981-Prorocentrum_lima.AAC.1